MISKSQPLADLGVFLFLCSAIISDINLIHLIILLNLQQLSEMPIFIMSQVNVSQIQRITLKAQNNVILP